jgi:hypothetical protein
MRSKGKAQLASPILFCSALSAIQALPKCKTTGHSSSAGVFGRPRLRITLPSEWALMAVYYGGTAITDEPVELRDRQRLEGLQVVVTNRLTPLKGTVVNAKSHLADGTVIAFPRDPDKWFDGSRYIRSVRSDQRGEWEVKGLPPGEYLAVGVDDLQSDEIYDTELLRTLASRGRHITLSDAAADGIRLENNSQRLVDGDRC